MQYFVNEMMYGLKKIFIDASTGMHPQHPVSSHHVSVSENGHLLSASVFHGFHCTLEHCLMVSCLSASAPCIHPREDCSMVTDDALHFYTAWCVCTVSE